MIQARLSNKQYNLLLEAADQSELKERKQAIQNKADTSLDLYLPLQNIHPNLDFPLWIDTCDNAWRLKPEQTQLRLSQLHHLST